MKRVKFPSHIFSQEGSHLPSPPPLGALFLFSSCGYEMGFELHGVGRSSCGRVVVMVVGRCCLGKRKSGGINRKADQINFDTYYYYYMSCTLLQENDNVIDHLYYWNTMAT